VKKSIVRLIVYATITSIVVFGFVIANHLLDRENILERVTKWPELQVYTLSGERISTSEILGDKPLMLYYYNTECIFCQGTFEELPNYIELMKESTLIFISDEDPEVVNNFITNMGMEDFKDVHFYYDADQVVKDFFAIRGVPAIYLYDQNGEMVELYRGATSLSVIRSKFQK
jgi:thiol-disulfide isomerase/thioredoxin